MKKLNLLRKSINRDERLGAYKLDLEIISSENISKEVFVKQRQRKDGKIDDVFQAIATPEQLEDLDINSPKEGSTRFRTSKICLVFNNPDTMEEIFNDILHELQHLVDDAEIIEELEVDGMYQITSDTIETNMATTHTHYRLPLTAAPAGTNDVFTDSNDGLQKQRVGSQDTNLPGWLNVSPTDPTGTFFKYNIPRDSTLYALWPIPSDRVAYAHIEKNGVTAGTVLINEDGIFWKSNKYGTVPWPIDYVNSGNPGTAANSVTLVLDIIR